MAAEPAAALARAKVNLHLHVLGRRGDGMHLLDSLAVFPELGDRLEAERSPGLGLSLAGPFADGLGGGDNLVLRAAEALQAAAPDAPGAALRLIKTLPVASGIGGGSADAAAALRLLDRLWDLRLGPSRLAHIGLSLGADVPACLGAPRPARMGGIGERLRPAPPLPGFWLALANPGRAAPTPEVFARLSRRDGTEAVPPAEGFRDAAALARWLRESTENMLESAALELVPEIGRTREALAARPGCLLARMSGSGATCYGIFAEEAPALAAAEALREAGDWAAAGPVAAPDPLRAASAGDAARADCARVEDAG